MAAMRPSRMEMSPSMTSKRSFIVRMSPLRIRRDMGVVGARGPPALRLQIVPAHRELGGVAALHLAVLDRNQLGEDADRDLLRGDGADVQADRRVHVAERDGRYAV